MLSCVECPARMPQGGDNESLAIGNHLCASILRERQQRNANQCNHRIVRAILVIAHDAMHCTQ
jgi:hypothetical protein